MQLFHEYVAIGFEGPFKKAGYKYRIEPRMLGKQGEDLRPDIAASGAGGWALLELTLNPAPKTDKLAAYGSIDPRILHQYGLEPHTRPPDAISARLTFFDDGPHCEIVVGDRLELRSAERLMDEKLREILIHATGTELALLPSLPFSLVPEMKGREIREGIVDIVMQLFDPLSAGKNPLQIVEEGLERLSENVSAADKSQLMDKVRTEMGFLIRDHLRGYLTVSDGVYKATDKVKEHHRTRNYIVSRLEEWIGRPGRVPPLNTFPEEPES